MRISIALPRYSLLEPMKKLQRAMKVTATGTQRALSEWYASLPEDYFDSANGSFPDGTSKHGGARSFMAALSSSWRVENVGEDGFTLSFRNPRENGSPWGLRLHQYGGTIRPKNARALTIPMTAEARGMRVAEFVTHRALFKIGRQGDATHGILAYREKDGTPHAAYALRGSAYVAPLRQRRGHDAVPNKAQMVDMARPYFLAALNSKS